MFLCAEGLRQDRVHEDVEEHRGGRTASTTDRRLERRPQQLRTRRTSRHEAKTRARSARFRGTPSAAVESGRAGRITCRRSRSIPAVGSCSRGHRPGECDPTQATLARTSATGGRPPFGEDHRRGGGLTSPAASITRGFVSCTVRPGGEDNRWLPGARGWTELHVRPPRRDLRRHRGKGGRKAGIFFWGLASGRVGRPMRKAEKRAIRGMTADRLPCGADRDAADRKRPGGI